eukprot:TRINITY_DN27711_c0_g1_i3.p1 TRINITY_DN27711_c0_g1~~TRINITY_DN27711_c0_g1_i3.p1  ORF type:complete len:204 (+),score=10.26 TRINITY_DN27711_c0_g1_i3:568-1179(+)
MIRIFQSDPHLSMVNLMNGQENLNTGPALMEWVLQHNTNPDAPGTCSRLMLCPNFSVLNTASQLKCNRSYRNKVATTDFIPWPVEIRFCDESNFVKQHNLQPSLKYWFKARGKLTDDPALHRCVVAYASDLIFLGVSTYPHRTKGLKITSLSLDHSMWFHRPFRADEWLLFVIESPSASNARGFIFGRMFNRRGEVSVLAFQH